MATIKRVTIPEPCTQQWHQMMPNNNDRHCSSCDKTVVDFTIMSNQEIIHYLSNSGNVCGRISAPQFDGINRQLAIQLAANNTGWKKWMMAAAVLTATMFNKAAAQSDTSSMQKTEQTPLRYATLGKIAMPARVESTFEGHVLDEQNLPLPGVKVTIKGTTIGTLTDVNGRFYIRGPVAARVLIFSYIGYEQTEKKIKTEAGKATVIKLKMVPMMLGGMGVIYGKPSLLKTLYSQCIMKPVGKLFS